MLVIYTRLQSVSCKAEINNNILLSVIPLVVVTESAEERNI